LEAKIKGDQTTYHKKKRIMNPCMGHPEEPDQARSWGAEEARGKKCVGEKGSPEL